MNTLSAKIVASKSKKEFSVVMHGEVMKTFYKRKHAENYIRGLNTLFIPKGYEEQYL